MSVQVSRTTRSGRVSRPPRHISRNVTSFQDDSAPTPFHSVSAQPKPEPKSFMFLPDVGKKRNVSAEFKCPTCDKVYLGQAKMTMHFEKNPTHRNMEKWNQILESLNKTDSTNKPGDEGLKPGLKPELKSGLGKKKGKKRRTYEECKSLLKKALEDCSKADVAVLAGPIVASVLSVWEFLVLRSAKMKLENENHVLALLRELKLLLNHIKSSADAFILPPSCSPIESQSQTNQIEIQDDATSHVLGLPCGKYRINNDYENSWLKSFSERSKKLTESDPSSKRSRQEEQLSLWPNSEVPTELPPPSPTETFDKGENDLNASNLLAESNHSSTAYIDEIMSQRLENLRTQQQNELNDCFTSVDDLINDLSVNMSNIGKNPIDKCDPSLDLNFVNFPRNDLFQLSMSDENRPVFPGSSSESGPCSSSLVSYVDDSMYDNMSSVITNASSTDDLMKSLASFELRPNDPMTFDPMNQFPLHENVSGTSEFPDNGGFGRSVELGNLVSSRGDKSLKEDASDDLDFVHSLDCLDPSI